MNIIIPICGEGKRFTDNGYNEIKPLIKVFDKEILRYVLDSLYLSSDDKLFIIHNKNNLFNDISLLYPNIIFIDINRKTKGTTETILLGLNIIKEKYEYNKKTLILDCDTFYTFDIINTYRNINNNALFYTIDKDDKPLYSYIKLNDNNNIIEIVEKNKISDYINTGVYCFNDIDILLEYCNIVVNKNITNEYYLSFVIIEMLNNNIIFDAIEINKDNVFFLGTPEQVDNYIKNTNAFLFDLDGTLIISDDIYYNIWCNILKEYNIFIDDDFYYKYIYGNSDTIVLNNIFGNTSLLNKISTEKNLLINKSISNITIIDGAFEFIKKIWEKGHKIAIVTNSDYIIAYNSVLKFNLDKYISFIISANNCVNNKPHPEPYLNAIKKFNIDNNKCYIFEDSKSGLISAYNSKVNCIIGIENKYNNYLLKYSDFIYKNYLDIDLDKLLSFNSNNINNIIKKDICKLFNNNITDVIINNKLKGGFIADIIDIEIINNTNKKNVNYCIIKIDNKKENILSTMANKLDLYNREFCFYRNIANSSEFPLKIPRCYGIIKDNDNKDYGIILENLYKKNYIVNLDLNNEDINVSLNIINEMSKMHAKYWNSNVFNLKTNNNNCYNSYIEEKWNFFREKWSNILNEKQLELGDKIMKNYNNIQKKLSVGNLTLCHGDIKSANIFYNNLKEPTFIDWQYIIYGKGVQDLSLIHISEPTRPY